MKMSRYQIWLSGSHATTQFIGEMVGYDFRDAVIRWYQRNNCSTFDSVQLTQEGRRLVPSMQDAFAVHRGEV